jgi:FixJ family two-component response regulator
LSEPSGDHRYISLTERLRVVRRQLDLLANRRLDRPLDPEIEQTYQALCHREQELLKAMSALT